MGDNLYMGTAEQRCLEVVKTQCNQNKVYYYGLSKEEQKQLQVLVSTAQDTDGKTTTFPDFIGENGWIEHFKVSSSKHNRKGSETNRKIASVNRAIEKQIKSSINEESLIHPFSSSFYSNGNSLENYRKSLENNWENHYQSYLKEQEKLKALEISAYMIESDDDFLKVARFDDLREGIIQHGNTELPFEIIYDKAIMEYILQHASYFNYVIFKSNYLVSILKTTAISKIIDELDYKNIVVYPIQGIVMRHGFHIGTELKLPDSFQP